MNSNGYYIFCIEIQFISMHKPNFGKRKPQKIAMLKGITGILSRGLLVVFSQLMLMYWQSEGGNICNFSSPTLLGLWVEIFLLVKNGQKWAFFKIDSMGGQ